MPEQKPHYVRPFEEDEFADTDQLFIKGRKSNLWLDAWRDMRRRPMFYISLAMILVVIAMALFPSWFTDVAPDACQLGKSNGSPEAGHPLGYTRQGCDIYSRIVYGAASSVSVGFLVVTMTFTVGVTLGALAGFFGGWVDAILSRLGDIFFSIPYILAAVVVMSVFSQHRNMFVVALAIGAFSWPITLRIVRSEILRVKNSDFATSAKAVGMNRLQVLWHHVLPNSMAPAIVVTTLSLASAIVAQAVLSFLGVGLPPDVMNWGTDISQAQPNLRTAPMALVYPSLALTITVLSFIMLGEVVRDALDPKARAQR